MKKKADENRRQHVDDESKVSKVQRKKNKTDAPRITTMAFLDQNNFPSPTILISCLSLLVSASIFFLVTYATNSISTDLVIVDTPKAITSYQDFLDRARAPVTGKAYYAVFSKLLQEYEKFANSDPPSLEYQVYQRRKMLTLKVEDMIEVAPGMGYQKVIAVGREVFVDGVALTTLMNARVNGWPESRMLRVQENDAKKFTNVMIWNRNVSKKFQVQTHKLLSRMHQGGIMTNVYNEAPVHIASNLLENVLLSVKNKITKRIELSNPDFIPVSMKNLNLLKSVILTLNLISIFVLSVEMFHFYAEKIIR